MPLQEEEKHKPRHRGQESLVGTMQGNPSPVWLAVLSVKEGMGRRGHRARSQRATNTRVKSLYYTLFSRRWGATEGFRAAEGHDQSCRD